MILLLSRPLLLNGNDIKSPKNPVIYGFLGIYILKRYRFDTKFFVGMAQKQAGASNLTPA